MGAVMDEQTIMLQLKDAHAVLETQFKVQMNMLQQQTKDAMMYVESAEEFADDEDAKMEKMAEIEEESEAMMEELMVSFEERKQAIDAQAEAMMEQLKNGEDPAAMAPAPAPKTRGVSMPAKKGGGLFSCCMGKKLCCVEL